MTGQTGAFAGLASGHGLFGRDFGDNASSGLQYCHGCSGGIPSNALYRKENLCRAPSRFSKSGAGPARGLPIRQVSPGRVSGQSRESRVMSSRSSLVIGAVAVLIAGAVGYSVLKGSDTATAPVADQSQTTAPVESTAAKPAAAEPAASASSGAAPVESAPTEAASCTQYTWNGEGWTCTDAAAVSGAN